MSDDLSAWLLEQIAEDERGAAQVSDRTWRYGPPTPPNDDGSLDCEGSLDLGRTVLFADHDTLTETEAQHIAAFDPGRVLAECDTKRRIIELHVGEHECREMHTGTYPADWPEGASYGAPGEMWRHASTEYFEDQPCETLRPLALPYADRPGYREEWQP